MSSTLWNQEDSEEEQEEQEQEQEQEQGQQEQQWGGIGQFVPARGVNEEFCQMIQTIKWKMYSGIILSPSLQTEKAQDNELIKHYVSQLQKLYVFLEGSMSHQIKEMMLSAFVMSLRHDILGCAKHMMEYGKTNRFQSVDWIPYRDYLNSSLRIHPFVHHKRMIGGQEDDVEDM